MSTPMSKTEELDRVRLIKQGYSAMFIAFCNIAAHKLVCANPDLMREYKQLSQSNKAPAESLDRKAWTALTLNRKAMATKTRLSSKPSTASDAPHSRPGDPKDKYLQSYNYVYQTSE